MLLDSDTYHFLGSTVRHLPSLAFFKTIYDLFTFLSRISSSSKLSRLSLEIDHLSPHHPPSTNQENELLFPSVFPAIFPRLFRSVILSLRRRIQAVVPSAATHNI